MNNRLAHHLLTALLLLPTVTVAVAWMAWPLRSRSMALPPLSPVTTWRWRIGVHYVTIEKIAPDVPFNTTLPGVNGGRSISPPASGVRFLGRPYLDPFGWVGRNSGYYLLGTRLRPAETLSFSLIIPLLATLPLAYLGVRRLRQPTLREQRRRAGLCVACGYDLRASPERCPECGAAVEPHS